MLLWWVLNDFSQLVSVILNVLNSDEMFTYAHTQVPAYVHSSAGQLVSEADLNKETEPPYLGDIICERETAGEKLVAHSR